DYLTIPLGKSEVIRFSEGNTFVKACETVRGMDVYIVQTIGLNPNDEFTELLFWLDTFKRASASTVTAIIPYFGYAKGDKKDEPRVSIRARVCAECIELAGADRVVTMDLHSSQIQGFFKSPVDHIYAMPLFIDYLKSQNIPDMVVVSPDAGFVKQARKYAGVLGCSVAIGDKARKGHDENAKILEIIGDIDGKNAVIVDDFSISGGTLIDLTAELKKRGVKKVYACLSHVLLSEKAVKRIEESNIDVFVTTDSVPNPHINGCRKIKTLSAAPTFAEAIKRIQLRESVSAIFDEFPKELRKDKN
ncbi:MAG: ribose-phosphate diphosphokinase, partial [Spirochaetia bacterium]